MFNSDIEKLNNSNIKGLTSKEDIINAVLKTTKHIDKKLTERINSIARGSRIEVYIDQDELMCDGKIPNCFTIMGFNNPNEMANGIAKMVYSFPVPMIFMLIISPVWILYVYYKYSHKVQYNVKYTYNEDKTIDIENIPYIPIFLTKEMYKMCDENELMAIFLHEVGHHEQFVKKMYEEMLVFIDNITGVNLFGFITFINMQNDLFNDNLNRDKFTFIYAPILACCFIISYFSNKFFAKDVEYQSDMCAVKCGYGPYLYSAFKKISERYEKKKNIFVRFFNICVKFLLFFIGFFIGSYQGSTHPKTEDRNKRILQYEKEHGNVTEDKNGNISFKINVAKQFINVFNTFINLIK